MLLQIPLTVEIGRERGNAARIEAFTLVVNAHGGLMEIGIPLGLGQKMLLLLPASGLQKNARVVGGSHDGNGFLIAFEFDCPTPKFWPIEFPPADWQAAEDVSGK